MSGRRQPASLVRHPSRAVPVGLLAVALGGIGAAGLWLLATCLVTDAWPAAASRRVEALASTRLDSVPVQVTAVVAGVLGVAMMLSALWPGRPKRLRALEGQTPGETALPRRDLARRIQHRAQHVDGVHSARVQVKRRRIDVAVQTVVDDPANVRHRATAAVERAVAELRPTTDLRPRVRVHRRS